MWLEPSSEYRSLSASLGLSSVLADVLTHFNPQDSVLCRHNQGSIAGDRPSCKTSRLGGGNVAHRGQNMKS